MLLSLLDATKKLKIELRRKTRGSWKVRARPRRAISCGGFRATCTPSNTISPAVGVRMPLMRLRTVVFPAPLGPNRLVSVPGSTENATLSTARRPPKLSET
jgi:hypothetical protein